ncbi:putative ABC transporter ATP-binding protein and permease component [Streptomyces bingchenggensis BCW-1]|uniref:Putative ABC transporter ATP-binding protein and permease component n=1 Tax=Streptomyces bingchenggensis (strain BCW-1) TaxID=749414 RepID=D7C8N3_STRBB|nr:MULTISPECIES: thiol reductant ABC exporter subunit CydD [Streptomyces]ADI08434.1 putative ABC transporter ATP-binding protein and permease component [Streptomyces bingchenggensis BCW-1]
MKPVDPRLLRQARATRLFLAASVALGLVSAGLVVAQAMLIAEVVVAAFVHGAAPGELGRPLTLLAAVAVGRAAVAWLTELAAHRAGAAVKSELRLRLLAHAVRLGPERMSSDRPGPERLGAPGGTGGTGGTGELTTLATRGIDALDDYFARYLPQLGLAVVVPVAVLARIVTADWVSALIIAATLPLIPLFMILIGWATQSRMDRQWRLLSRLSGHFLDVVAGLPTLKVFGRAKAQAASIRAITADYRRATLRTLRLAFLSSFALELLSTVSVALVAVGIGMRLVHGELDLYTGLVVLVLAPEAYLPLRQVGAQYHAAAEGLTAADEVFAVLEREPRATGAEPAPDARGAALSVQGLVVRHPGRAEPSLAETSFEILPGETVAVVGPSGAGKTTLLGALLGFAEPAAGRVLVAGRDLASLDPDSWRGQVAWVPQRPYLFAGTVAENVRLARPDADDAALRAALRDAGALDFVDALPHGADTRLGEMGAGLSAGQRQRIALARAFLADRPVLLLDEPTAGLDGETEAAVVEAVRRLAEGRTVLLVVHRPALLPLADRVVRLPGPTAAPPVAAVPSTVPADGAHQGADRGAPDAPSAYEEHQVPERRSPLAWVRESGRAWRGRFALALLLGSLALGSAVGLMAVSGWLISRASQQPPVLYLMVAVTATRAFGIGRAVFRYAERLVSHDAVLRVLAELRVAVYRRLERLAPVGLKDTRRGDLLSRLVADVDALQDYFLRWLLPVGAALAVGVASVGFTGRLLPEAGAVLAAGLLMAGIVAPLVSGAVARHAERRLAPARGALSAQVVDLLTGTAELTVAGALPRRLEEVRRADGNLTRIARRAAAATGVGAGLSALACGLTVAAAALVGVRAVADGRLDGVWLAVVVLMPLAAFEAVAGLPLAVQHRQRVRRAARRVYDVVDGADGAPEQGQDPAATETPQGAYPLVLSGISARYPGRTEPALDGFDLELRPGRRIAVVGPSGSGKTTLAHVLLRFLDPRTGTYTLASRDTAAMDPDAVRRLVGLCAQDAHIFDSSLRENLRLARTDASDGELREALAAARLLEWVDGLPDGLDTLVGESGARLSGGQRQRLALARALLADFPVLVLDEPAEHLDLPTADALTADLLSATRGRTTVLITHRLAGLEAVDEVVVLDRGRAVQRGPYAQLAAANGPFRRMLEREAGEGHALAAAAPPVRAAAGAR